MRFAKYKLKNAQNASVIRLLELRQDVYDRAALLVGREVVCVAQGLDHVPRV
jgi:hypothetical protein